MARKLLWIIPLGFVAVFFYLPILQILGISLVENPIAIISQENLLQIIGFTIWQAVVSAVITVVISLPGAYLLYRKSFAGSAVIRALITVPFVLPSIVVAIGFTAFRNLHSIYQGSGLTFLEDPRYWIIAAHVFVNYSIAVRTIGGVWAGLDSNTEEAAALDGAGRLRTFFSIALPQLQPAIFSALALIFLFSATSFGIMLVLGGGTIQSIETAIYFYSTSFLDLETASALVLVQTLITAIAFAIGSGLARGVVGLEVIDEAANKPKLDSRDLIPAVFSGIIFFGLLALPIALVCAEAFRTPVGFGFDNFLNLFHSETKDLLNLTVLEATGNSLRNMLLAAVIAFGIGTLISWLLARTRAKFMDLIFLMPLGVSTVVLGLGYLVFFDSNWLALRSSWLIVPLAQSLIALPLVVRLVYPALVALGREPIEQAQLDGANSIQSWIFVESGMIRGVLTTAFSYAGLVSLGEFGAASFLALGSQSTIPTLLYRLISRPGEENYGMAMAISAVLIAISFLVVYLAGFQNRNRFLRALNE